MNRVGVLALQGDVPQHAAVLAELLPPGAVRMVRGPEDLAGVDGLLMPGGESTTIGKLLRQTGLDLALVRRARDGFPILATCAGFILLAGTLEASPTGNDPEPLGLLDVHVRRNDYGRQRESFEADVVVEGLTGAPFPGVFIRAPRILRVGSAARPLARRATEIVGVEQGAIWGLTFHPELSGDPRLLRRFLSTHGLLGGPR
jgi:pyridoxal 5'-phosphate synthase pdxT subunit